ncbi:MAG: alpha/beta fold hydrolase, partial [Planctomycetes bacterium]|nr:alpha/beta fold hydrolase [Planctomycetota bacterium]
MRSWHRAEAPSGLALRWRPGAGQPVVGLHGLGSRGEDLLALAEALPGAPVALIDLPGFGATPGSVGDLAGLAEHLLEALDVLRWERPVWLGCSFGGHVALRVSLDAPERVGALVLADSGGLDPAPAPELRALFAAQALAQRSEEDVARALDALVARPCAATRAYRARRLASHSGGS